MKTIKNCGEKPALMADPAGVCRENEKSNLRVGGERPDCFTVIGMSIWVNLIKSERRMKDLIQPPSCRDNWII